MVAAVTVSIAACAPAARLARYEDADVLFTTPAEVNRLCQLAPVAAKPTVILGCYVPALRLAIVPPDAPALLAHELRHAREGQFHR